MNFVVKQFKIHKRTNRKISERFGYRNSRVELTYVFDDKGELSPEETCEELARLHDGEVLKQKGDLFYLLIPVESTFLNGQKVLRDPGGPVCFFSGIETKGFVDNVSEKLGISILK